MGRRVKINAQASIAYCWQVVVLKPAGISTPQFTKLALELPGSVPALLLLLVGRRCCHGPTQEAEGIEGATRWSKSAG